MHRRDLGSRAAQSKWQVVSGGKVGLQWSGYNGSYAGKKSVEANLDRACV